MIGRRLLLTLCAGGLGFVLNGFGIQVFENGELILGGWLGLLIAIVYGPWYGALAAAIAASRTCLLWQHPFALICYTIEGFAVGWLVQRRRWLPIVASGGYWLIIGMPMVALYTFVLVAAPWPMNCVWIIKYAANGLLMSPVASLLSHWTRVQKVMGVDTLVEFNVPLENMLFRRFGVIVALSLAVVNFFAGRTYDRSLKQLNEQNLVRDTQDLANDIEAYVNEHQRIILSLADPLSGIGRESTDVIGHTLEATRLHHPGFITLLVTDENGDILTTAPANLHPGEPASPQNISVRDRAYFREPMATGQPYTSSVFQGRGLGTDLIIALSAPVLGTDGKPHYVVEGSLRLAEFQNLMKTASSGMEHAVVIVDQYQRVIASSGTPVPLPVLSPFQDTPLHAATAGPEVYYYDQTQPGQRLPVRYLGATCRVPGCNWKVFLSVPLWETEKAVASYYLVTTLWTLLGIGLALLLSRGTASEITRPLKALVQATRDIANGQPAATPPDLPHTAQELIEINRDLRDAALTLSRANLKLSDAVKERDRSHQQLRQVLLHLDDKVHQRTTQLEQARVAAESANHAKSEFLSSMSHELRTPLNVILGMTEILGEHTLGNLNPRQAECILAIDESGRHLLSLINDILDLSKIEADMLHLDVQEVEVRDICEASLRFVQETALKKGIHLVRAYRQRAAVLVADQRRLKQILVNLLSNAVKFTPKDGSVTLEVTENADAATLTFAVIDTGIGIAPENLDKLFKSFQQIDSALNRSYSGTGLGLALVKRMTEMHQGSVAVESTPGHGSRFAITLPLNTSASGATANRPTSLLPPALPTLTINGNPLILIAEDNETNIQLYTEHLRPLGCRFIFAGTGFEAVTKARSDRPDLILMDVQMPEMDGLSATRLIRVDPEISTIPIITVTALATNEDRLRCLEAGATAYMSKPLKLRDLSNLMAELLQARHRIAPTPPETSP